MKKILIVDDEEAVCWALNRALTQEGHRVLTAGSAEEGLSLAEKESPDTIVLDVRLPGMDGLSALAKFRELAPDAPVIIITAFGNLTTAVRAVEGGAFDYLGKPFDLDQALEAIGRALQKRSAPAAAPAANGEMADTEIIGRSQALQVVFKDKAAHDKYQDAALHLQFISENKENWKKVRVFDAFVEK